MNSTSLHMVKDECAFLFTGRQNLIMSLFIGIHETESFELRTPDSATNIGEMGMKDVVSEGSSSPR